MQQTTSRRKSHLIRNRKSAKRNLLEIGVKINKYPKITKNKSLKLTQNKSLKITKYNNLKTKRNNSLKIRRRNNNPLIRRNKHLLIKANHLNKTFWHLWHKIEAKILLTLLNQTNKIKEKKGKERKRILSNNK